MGLGQSKEPEPQVNLDEYLRSAEYQQKVQAVYNQQQANQQELNVRHTNDDDDFFYAGHNPVSIHQQRNVAQVQQTTLTAQKNDIYINKTSFKLVPCGPKTFYLTFQYTSPCDGIINIWYMGQENMATSQITTQYRKEQIDTFPISSCQNAAFAPNQSILDLSLVKVEQLKHFEIKKDQFSFPIIVKISKNVDHSFTYYCNIDSNPPNLNPHCQASKLRVNGQSFLTQDVYGMNDSVLGNKNENEKEPCRICLTNIIDTMIKPCQHVVLCQECCLNLRRTGQKCPICRTEIKEFVIIRQGN